MKIQLETFEQPTKSPFRLLHDPKLNHLYYWHFHPEFELVYIEGASAKRHVGDHISHYKNNDLVLIGSNIPHLNFDHGVKTNYLKEVLHIKPSFKTDFIEQTSELQSLEHLLELSKYGIAFTGSTKTEIGKLMKTLHTLSPFDFFMRVVTILKLLSQSKEFELLHKKPFINKYRKKEQGRLRKIYGLIDERYQDKISLDEIATLCHMTKPAFCRYFKKATGTTFIGFLNQYRISQAKRLLLTGKNISETCYACGFESLSYFNRTFRKITDENPSEFRRRYLNQ
ncbi:helix-turn-helix transcriptional regulator [Maribacter polysiphoniae]|uniref:AraC family transcriptional regulator n=1 Tax=Maribacter polysiphoniae TaxID=429344 RepID=A0A316ERK0_9FLAO|nr:AraC family transcriptional regulator [Maribacter polysiphoniae]MBD1260248.1 helix-turn-helix transcriptional regulator [Maribacter polysiphoniae]PWK25710.1 AraC family transcriptional regulator [Maribacter polysiphoniae]